MKKTASRRQFIKRTARLAAGAAALPLLGSRVFASAAGAGVAIVLEDGHEVAKSASARWAAEQLRDTLNARGLTARIFAALEQAPAGWECILASGRDSNSARQVLESNRIALPEAPESLAVARGSVGKRAVTLACGADARGLVYALLDLADRAELSADAPAALRGVKPAAERPANRIRSVSRLFVSDVEDREWFNDRAFWREYLTMLAAQRFNRFSLALGIGYDFTTNIRDCYFHFAYPFLVSVPGYDVRAAPLPEAERRANLETLKFISDEAALRGLHFQLGLWTHAYKWTNSPRANYVIEGLTDATQGPYSRDALRTILEACPGIAGVTFRIHGESGVPEGSYDFWRTVFDGMVKCGRRVELDMHAKGMDQATIDTALATGLPVTISPKFWAEHLGLPYMQASIRNLEMPPRDARDNGFFSRSSGSRSFLRYSYGDLLTEDRRYAVLHRFWPGTQRVLLWGDPAFAAAYGRAAGFCGSDGLELFEPESFKGRKGSGLPGGREGYAEEALKTGVGGWKKHLYAYRLWGRLTYHPAAEPDTWQRALRHEFGAGAAETALAEAGRILPLVTTAHCPSAANNTYWPEMYFNMPVVDARRPHPYGDSPAPRRFGTVSPLDPELFSGVDEFADEWLKGAPGAKYSPAEVAQWLERMAKNSAKSLAESRRKTAAPQGPEFRRLETDVAIQGGLGMFFAEKLRAGMFYSLFLRSGHAPALPEALKSYRRARDAWAGLAERGKGIYAADITYGVVRESRGHWLDRLAAMDGDIADMEKMAAAGRAPGAEIFDAKMLAQAMAAVKSPPERPSVKVEHTPPGKFRRGEAVAIDFSAARGVESARLHYRRVNQAETWRAAEMKLVNGRWQGTIPAECADSVFPLQYYFELRGGAGSPWLHPGLGAGLAGQPYFVVRQA